MATYLVCLQLAVFAVCYYVFFTSDYFDCFLSNMENLLGNCVNGEDRPGDGKENDLNVRLEVFAKNIKFLFFFLSVQPCLLVVVAS